MTKILMSMLLLLSSAAVLAGKKQTLSVRGVPVDKQVVRITFDGDNAVLQFDDDSEQREPMSDIVVRYDDETSGISEVKPDNRAVRPAVFDLQGRKVTGDRLRKGVYIIDGQKVVIR